MLALIPAIFAAFAPAPPPRRRGNSSGSLRPAPVRAVCHDCGGTFHTRSFVVDACPHCGGADVTILAPHHKESR